MQQTIPLLPGIRKLILNSVYSFCSTALKIKVAITQLKITTAFQKILSKLILQQQQMPEMILTKLGDGKF